MEKENSKMTATNDTLGPQEWREKCEQFLNEEKQRQAAIQYYMQLQNQARLSMVNAVTPLQYALANQRYTQAVQMETQEGAN